MRGTDTPTPQQMAQVAGRKNFQSMIKQNLAIERWKIEKS
jgi:hypothetical protein